MAAVRSVATVLLLAGLAPAIAHDGHVHVEDQRPTMSAGVKRSADGSVFIAKEVQRQQGLRTIGVHAATVARTRALPGRITADPNHSAIVQAPQAGVLQASTRGLPTLGQRFKKGDIIAYLHLSLTNVERAAQQAHLAIVEKDLFLAKQQFERLQDQGITASGNFMAAPYEVAVAEYESLVKQKAELEAGLAQRLPLTAPIDGIISQADIFAGKVVAQGETLLNIVDPAHLWVEALSYDTALQPQHSAYAVTGDHRQLALTLIGEPYQLTDQTLPLQFAISAAPSALAVGQAVEVFVRTQEQQRGFIVPSSSLSADRDGVPIIWVHAAPEYFAPRKVRAENLDGKQHIVLQGLAAGQRVVTAGADVLTQLP